jgi:hypothetical protein
MSLMHSFDYANSTLIYRDLEGTGQPVGYVSADGTIFKLRWNEGLRVGRVSSDRRVFRDTRHDERELGAFSSDGRIRSHGLFEGGDLGWVESDGTVIQAGMILGEEEIGLVKGRDPFAAGAALLLIFYPDELEQANRANR